MIKQEVIAVGDIPRARYRCPLKYQGVVDKALDLATGQALRIADVDAAAVTTLARYGRLFPIKVMRRSLGNNKYDVYIVRKEEE